MCHEYRNFNTNIYDGAHCCILCTMECVCIETLDFLLVRYACSNNSINSNRCRIKEFTQSVRSCRYNINIWKRARFIQLFRCDFQLYIGIYVSWLRMWLWSRLFSHLFVYIANECVTTETMMLLSFVHLFLLFDFLSILFLIFWNQKWLSPCWPFIFITIERVLVCNNLYYLIISCIPLRPTYM